MGMRLITSITRSRVLISSLITRDIATQETIPR
jgi:hypothetical protein